MTLSARITALAVAIGDSIKQLTLAVAQLGTDVSKRAKTEDLAPVALSGQYSSLSGKPDLSAYALSAGLSQVAVDNQYASLSGKPDLTVYARTVNLATVAFSGQYSALLGRPDLSIYAQTSALKAVAFSGQYADLVGPPNLAVYALTSSLAQVAFDGLYGSLLGKPDLTVYAKKTDLASVATSNDYKDLSGTPDLTKYVLVTSKGQALGVVPLNASGKIDTQYFSFNAVNFKGVWDASTNTPTLSDTVGSNGDMYICKVGGVVDLGGGSMTMSANDQLFYASDIGRWVNVAASAPVLTVNGKSGTVTIGTDDIVEGASNLYFTAARAQSAQLQPDWAAAPGLKSHILNKPEFSGVAYSGQYGDLIGRPNLSAYALSSALHKVAGTGDYGDLSNLPNLSIFAETADLPDVAKTGSFGDLLDIPQFAAVAFSGSYFDLSDRPIGGVKLEETLIDPPSASLGGAWLLKDFSSYDGELETFLGAMPLTYDEDQFDYIFSVQTSQGVRRVRLT